MWTRLSGISKQLVPELTISGGISLTHLGPVGSISSTTLFLRSYHAGLTPIPQKLRARFPSHSLNTNNTTHLYSNAQYISKRFNSQLPDSIDKRDPLDNSLQNRLPKFPFHKEAQPTLIPKSDTPRVSKTVSFRKLMSILKNYEQPELLYMAESHRLYIVACFALSFIVCYNIYDLLDRAVPAAIDEYKRNEEDLPPVRNAVKCVGNMGMVLAIAAVYTSAAICFALVPTRLVRRLYYLPGAKEHIQFVTHPFLPGRPSPVITIPLEKVTIGNTSKVWTGKGFYGTANRTQFMFLLFEKGKLAPWIVDRSGWFWGDGRVWDVLFGKEPVDQAELGLSYDDMLKIRQKEVDRVSYNLKQELGPAWKLKAMAKLMKEDLQTAGEKLGVTDGKPGSERKKLRGPGKKVESKDE